MNNSHKHPDSLAELATQLLECGAVISQIIQGVAEFEAVGRSAPGTVPIPEWAQGLLCSALEDLPKRNSARDLGVAAAIVKQATKAICDNVFIVSPELLDQMEF